MERIIRKAGICAVVIAILAISILWIPGLAHEPSYDSQDAFVLSTGGGEPEQDKPEPDESRFVPELMSMTTSFKLNLDLNPSAPGTAEPEVSEPDELENEPGGSSTPETPARIISAIDAPSPVQAPAGTLEEDLELPLYLTGTVDGVDGTEIPLSGWLCDGSYDPLVSGEYRFSPLLAEGYELSGTVLPALTLTVEEAGGEPELNGVTVSIPLRLPDLNQIGQPPLFTAFSYQSVEDLRSQVDKFTGFNNKIVAPSTAYKAALDGLLKNIPGAGGYPSGMSLPFYKFADESTSSDFFGACLKLPANVPMYSSNYQSGRSWWTDLPESSEQLFNDYFFRVIAAVMYDHPEIFWLGGEAEFEVQLYFGGDNSSMGADSKAVYISVANLCPGVDTSVYPNARNTYNELQSAVNKYVAALESLPSRREQIKTLFEMLCKDVIYDPVTLYPDFYYGRSTNWAHDVTGAMLTCLDRPTPLPSAYNGQTLPTGAKIAVCEGYAKAFKLVCDSLGIPCVLVVGVAGPQDENHMWNYVQIDDDKWYAMDVTWGDGTALDGTVNGTTYNIWYEYLLAGRNTIIPSGGTFSADHRESYKFFEDTVITDLKYPSYEDIAYASAAKKALDGSAITSSGKWVYGEPLSTVGFSGSMTVSGDSSTTVSGRFEWKNSADIADAGTGSIARHFMFYPADTYQYEVYDSSAAGHPGVTVNYDKRKVIVIPDAGQSGVYNGTTTPTVEISYTAANVLAKDGDIFTGKLELNGKDAGPWDIVKGSLAVNGTYSSKYDMEPLASPAVSYTVTPKPITVTGNLTGLPAVATFSSSPTVDFTGLSISANPGVYAPDVVTISGTATFTNPMAERSDNPYTYNLSTTLGGVQAGNYSLTTTTGYGNNGVITSKSPPVASPTAVYYVETPVASPTHVIKLSEITFDGMPSDAGTLTFTLGTNTSTNVIDNVTSLSGGDLTFEAQSSPLDGKTDTINVTIKSTNYEDHNAVITVMATSKTPVEIRVAGTLTRPYNGVALSPTVTFWNGSTEVFPAPSSLKWRYGNRGSGSFGSVGLPKNAGEYDLKAELVGDPDYIGYVIVPAEIKKVDVEVKAKDRDVPVGAPYPVFEPVYIPGLIGSEKPLINPIFTSTLTTTSAIAPATDITLTNLTDMNAAERNYTFSEASPRGKLTVKEFVLDSSNYGDYVSISEPHASGWYNGSSNPLTITPIPKDGFNRISVDVNDGSGFSARAASYTVAAQTADTGKTLSFRLFQGNGTTQSGTYSFSYKLDATPPAAPVLSYSGQANGGFIVVNGISDANSGVDVIKIDGPSGYSAELKYNASTGAGPYKAAVTLTGTYTVTVYDKAGNSVSDSISPRVRGVNSVSIGGASASNIYPVGSTVPLTASHTGDAVEGVDFEYHWYTSEPLIASPSVNKGRNMTLSFRGLGSASIYLAAENQSGELAYTILDVMTSMQNRADTTPSSGVPAINIPNPSAALPSGVNLNDLNLLVTSLSPTSQATLWNTLNSQPDISARIGAFLPSRSTYTASALNVQLLNSTGTAYQPIGNMTLYLPYPVGTNSSWSFLAFRETSGGSYVETTVTPKSGWLELSTNYLGNIQLIAKISSTVPPTENPTTDSSQTQSWVTSTNSSGWNSNLERFSTALTVDERVAAAWAAIVLQIQETADGKGLRVIMARDVDTVPRDVLAAILGRNITLHFKWPDGRSVIINGLSLKLPDGGPFTYDMLLALELASPDISGQSQSGSFSLDNPDTGGDYPITFTLPSPEPPLATITDEAAEPVRQTLLELNATLPEIPARLPETLAQKLPSILLAVVISMLAMAAILLTASRKDN